MDFFLSFDFYHSIPLLLTLFSMLNFPHLFVLFHLNIAIPAAAIPIPNPRPPRIREREECPREKEDEEEEEDIGKDKDHKWDGKENVESVRENPKVYLVA